MESGRVEREKRGETSGYTAKWCIQIKSEDSEKLEFIKSELINI